MANSGPVTNGSQFYINQNKDDISANFQTDRFPVIDAIKNGGNPTSMVVTNRLWPSDRWHDVVDKMHLPKPMIRTNQNRH